MKLHRIILDCIYPGRCPLCHDIVMPKGRMICRGCETGLRVLKEPRCKCCSKMLPDDQSEYCADCKDQQYTFDGGFSIFPYDALMQRSLIQFKFHGRKEYGEFYGKMILRFAGHIIDRWKPDVLIPVPIHKSKRRVRGYNQAEIIGAVLSQGGCIPVRNDLVKRIKHTKAQKELNKKERRRNLQGAFSVEKKVKEYPCVLIVDDIYTTGSTVNELAGVLKKHGVKRVYFVTVSIGGAF